jgi:histone deacetylase 6
MQRTCTIYHNTEAMIGHEPPSSLKFMECPERILAIERALKGSGVWALCKNVLVENPVLRPALVEEYGEKEIHDIESKIPSSEKPVVDKHDGDIYWSKQTLRASSIAVAATIRAVDDVLDGKSDTAFCSVRPPGHHCFDIPTGFCVFNNVVFGARQALKRGKKVAIIDWDYHFGDGTARALLNEENVMFVSLHAANSRHGGPTYPPNVFQLKDDNLAKVTFGRMFNVQWDLDNADDAACKYAFDHLIIPRLKLFAPDLILISAGFDAARGDTLAGMDLSVQSFGFMASTLSSLGIPTVAVLEGGYNPTLLGICAVNTVDGLLGMDDFLPSQWTTPYPRDEHKNVVDRAVRYISYLRG